MKRICLCFVICILATLPSYAQSFDNFTAQVGAGFAVPIGPTNRANTGFSFTAAAGPRVARNLSILLDVGFNKLDIDRLDTIDNDIDIDNDVFDNVDSVNAPLDANMKMWSFTLNPSFEFVRKENWSWFAQGGYGVYYRKLSLDAVTVAPGVVCDDWWGICGVGFVSTDTLIGDRSTWKGGFNFGTGFTVGTKTKFFMEVRYNHMLTTNTATQTIPVNFGIRW